MITGGIVITVLSALYIVGTMLYTLGSVLYIIVIVKPIKNIDYTMVDLIEIVPAWIGKIFNAVLRYMGSRPF